MNDALLAKPKEEAIDVAGARNVLGELEASCRKLEQARYDVFSFLKTKLEPMSKKIGDSQEYSQAVKDHTAVTEFIGLLNRVGNAGIERLQSLTGRAQKLKAAELGNDFVDRIDTCRKNFNELKMPKGLAVVQNRIDRSLKSQAEGKTASEVNISVDLGRFIQAAREASGLPDEAPPSGVVNGDEGGKPDLGPVEKKWPDKLAGIEGVKKALDLVDREVDAVIEKRLAPFREYSEADMRHPSLQALRAMVKSEAAELLYRLSQPERALALWNDLIAEDALNLDALKNIAVYESLNEKDHSAILGAWRAYGWADFHRDFASAYSAGLLKDEVEARQGKKDATNLLSVANSPGYLEEFISHKVAEFLNRRMNLNTPTLVLGVERTAGPERRQKALDEMLSFVQEACTYLPPKAQEGFRKICSDLLRKAFEACAGTEGRTISKNIDFDRDEEKYVHWIADVYRLKKTFFVALRDSKDWIHKIKSVDFLPLLDRLNMLPTGTSADYQESAVSSLRAGEASAVIETLDFMVTGHTVMVLQYLFDDRVDRKRREDLFWKLAAGLTRYRPFWEKLADRNDENLKNVLKAIDEASRFYPEEVIKSLKGTDGSGAAAKFLEERCRRYPALTGPAQHLFILYHKQRVPEKAIPFLEAAAKNGFWKEGREECRKHLNSLKLPGEIDGLLKSKNYRGALKVLRMQMKENPASQAVLDSLVKCYSDWIENKPIEAGSLILDIDSDIETWLEGARQQLEAKDVATLKRNKHALLTNAALASLGKLDNVEKMRQLEEAMSGLLKRDGENMPAVYYLMIANFQKALHLANSSLMAEARTEFRKADRLANRLLTEAQDDYRNKAREYKQQIEKARAQLGF